MSILKGLTALLSKAAKNPTVKAAVLTVAVKVASTQIDKTGAKLKVPVEVREIAKSVLTREAEKARDLAAVDAIARL